MKTDYFLRSCKRLPKLNWVTDQSVLLFRIGTAFSISTCALAEQNMTVLPSITVTAEQSDGTVENGYRAEQVSQAGPWQGRLLQDLPYSIQVYSEDLIENLQSVVSTDEVYRINPTMQLNRSQYENDQPSTFLRGFRVYTIYRDGLAGDQYGHGTSSEDAEKIEVFNGLSGFLYGPGNVGGMINYVSKRSTDNRLNKVTIGNAGGRNWYIGGDFGGKFDHAGTLGYRVNAVKQGGETAIKHQNIKKDFVSLALDWQPSDNFVLQLDAMYREYDLDGKTADWDFAKNNIKRFSAKNLDNTISWGQPWSNSNYESQRYGAHLKWLATNNLTLRMNYLDSTSDRITQPLTNVLNTDGTYSQTIPRIYAKGINRRTSQQLDKRGSIYLDYQFDTASIIHKMTFGYQATDTIQKRFANDAKDTVYENLSLNYPSYFPQGNGQILDRGPLLKRSHSQTESWLLGDDIQFNDKWSALLGAAYVTIENKLTNVKQSAFTPNISILYKPVDTLTTYATYIESLESGGTAPDNVGARTVINAGQQFDPLKSKQIELGAKYTLNDRLSLNTAIFQINKGLQYSQNIDDNFAEYVQDGRQIHKGFEFTSIGKLTDNINIVGGFTYLQPKIKEQKQRPELEGNLPAMVAKQMYKLYAEYTVPQFENLSLSAGAIYTGKSYANDENTDVLPAYTIFNVGARYSMNLQNIPITLRMNLNNVLNKHYWANDSILGDPRTFMISTSFQF